jgi:hypothetical protein
MLKTAEHIWTDCRTNTQIAMELNAAKVLNKMQEYRRNGISQVQRTMCDGL